MARRQAPFAELQKVPGKKQREAAGGREEGWDHAPALTSSSLTSADDSDADDSGRLCAAAHAASATRERISLCVSPSPIEAAASVAAATDATGAADAGVFEGGALHPLRAAVRKASLSGLVGRARVMVWVKHRLARWQAARKGVSGSRWEHTSDERGTESVQ